MRVTEVAALIRLREEIRIGQRLVLAEARRLLPAVAKKAESAYPRVFDWIEWPYVNLTGYHRFIPDLKSRKILDLPGDVLEIGAYLGVGTAKLAAEVRKKGKRVYAVDTFEPATDIADPTRDSSPGPFTSALLRGRSQFEVYERNIRRYASDIVTLRGDSRTVSLPPGLRLCFSFIDGNHDPEHLQNDFDITWSRTVEGGVVGFDDYGHDLPKVTAAIDRFIQERQSELSEVWTVEPKQIFLRKAED